MFDKIEYEKFLQEKEIIYKPTGFEVSKSDINSVLFPFQNDFTRYAIRKGRSAVFAEVGLGKTVIQLEYARIVNDEEKCQTLIIAPLNVAHQTIDMGHELLDIDDIQYSNDGTPKDKITITNYEHMYKFNSDDYGCVIADESSIFKSENGKFKKIFFEKFPDIQYKLFLSATPNPNDELEITNQCEGLSVMDRQNVKSSFFVHDDKIWRLKGHSEHKFYKWMASWAMAIMKPSDLGYSDDGFNLPLINIYPVFLQTDNYNGQLIAPKLKGIRDRQRVRRKTLKLKCNYSADLVNQSNEQWIVWCDLNDEANLMEKLIPGSVQVAGTDKYEHKINSLRNFVNGNIRALVTKPKIFGFGVNLQNSWNSVMVGMTDSWETFWQIKGRQHRFRQEHEVNFHIVLTDLEQAIYNNVMQKEKMAMRTRQELIKNVAQYEREEILGITSTDFYEPQNDFIMPKFLRS